MDKTKKCQVEIDAILKKHNYKMNFQLTFPQYVPDRLPDTIRLAVNILVKEGMVVTPVLVEVKENQ